jgi:ankyrin repeat protein
MEQGSFMSKKGNGFTPLLRAVVDNNVNISDIRFLAKTGDPSCRVIDKGGEWDDYNAIHVCAYHNNSVALQAICEAKHQNLNHAINAYIAKRSGRGSGFTPLLMASLYKYADIVKLLVQNGADPSLCRTSYNSSEVNWYAYNAIHICVNKGDEISLQSIWRGVKVRAFWGHGSSDLH